MAAGDRHTGSQRQGFAGHQRHAYPGRVVAFVNMQIDAATMALGQLQQRADRPRILETMAERGPQHAPQQPTGAGDPSGQGLTLGREPVVDRHQGHQLQGDPPAPGPLLVAENLPAGFAGGASAAVDMAADRPQSVAPGLLQGPLAALLHQLGRSGRKLKAVGGQGAGHGATGVGEVTVAERLVEVGVGVDRRRDRQGCGCAHPCGCGLQAAHHPRLELQLHRHQAFVIGRRQLLQAGVDEAAGNAQTHVRAGCWFAEPQTGRPVPAS